jgi:hypothetical protein
MARYGTSVWRARRFGVGANHGAAKRSLPGGVAGTVLALATGLRSMLTLQ